MTRTLLVTAAAVALMSAPGFAVAAQSSSDTRQGGQHMQQSQAAGQSARLERMLGKQVVGSDGKPIGQIADIMLTPDTHSPNIAVIDTNEGKQIAVDYKLLQTRGSHVIARQTTQQQVAQMPAYQATGDMVSLSQDRGGMHQGGANQGGMGQGGGMNQGGAMRPEGGMNQGGMGQGGGSNRTPGANPQ